MEKMPEQPQNESFEAEPSFEYTFFRDHEEVFKVVAKTREEAFAAFEEEFGKKFNPEDGDGFIRI